MPLVVDKMLQALVILGINQIESKLNTVIVRKLGRKNRLKTHIVGNDHRQRLQHLAPQALAHPLAIQRLRVRLGQTDIDDIEDLHVIDVGINYRNCPVSNNHVTNGLDDVGSC